MTKDIPCRYEGYDTLMASLRGQLKELFSDCNDFQKQNSDFLNGTMLDRMTMPHNIGVDFINATLDESNQRIHITIHGASTQQLNHLSDQLKELNQADIIRKKPLSNQSDEIAIHYQCAGDQTGKQLAKALHNTIPAHG